MTRVSVRAISMALLSLALAAPAARAGVKTEERTQVQLGGFLGGVMNRFGGKAAKEGVVGTVAVVGDRKLTLNDQTGRIVDLAEEKIYDLDVRKKTYKVTTFAELRRQMEEQRAKAEKEAREAQKETKDEKQEPQQPQKEYEVDFDVKSTGQSRQIAGFDAKQVVTTITVREKGRTVQQSGGVIVTSDTWQAPKIPAMKELADFDRRYAARMAEAMGVAGMPSMEQMAAVFAMYPGISKALEKMKAENVSMDGTPVLTTLTITGVKSAAQMAQAERQDEQPSGIGGFLAKKMVKKKENPGDPRSMLMTATVEVLKVAPNATAADVALPADYKAK